MSSGLGVFHILKRASELFPYQEVIASEGRTTYKKIYEDALRLANFLKKEGIGDGDVIAILDFNNIKYMTLVYAASLINAVVYPVNFKLPYYSIKRNLEIAKVKAIFCGRIFGELVKLTDLDCYDLSEFNEWIKNNNSLNSEPDPSSDFALLFNSNEKELQAVIYTQEQLHLAVMSLISHLCIANSNLKLDYNDTILSLINMNYIFSWGSIFIAPLIGAKLVLLDWFHPDDALKIISQENVTYLFAFPSMIDAIIEKYSNFPNLKVLVGGDIITPYLAHKLREAKIDYYYLFSSEIHLALGTSMVQSKYRKAVDANRIYPLPFVELKVIKGDFKEAAINEVGEIFCKTSWNPRIIYSRDNRANFKGWYKTGTIGMKEEDGGINILGFSDRIIRSGDEIIPANYIEALIKDVARNSEIIVLGVPDEKWGERPIAFVKGWNVEVSRIWEYLYYNLEKGRISKWWVPLQIYVVDELPSLDSEENKSELLRLIKTRRK